MDVERRMGSGDFEARAALTLNPNSAFVIGTLGCVLGFGGNRDEALDRLHLAMRASPHDPLTWLWTNWRACIQFYSRQFDAAPETCRELARLRPEYGSVHGYIPGSLALLGRGTRHARFWSAPDRGLQTRVGGKGRPGCGRKTLPCGRRNPMTPARRLAAILADVRWSGIHPLRSLNRAL
jgi:hypothetical protein